MNNKPIDVTSSQWREHGPEMPWIWGCAISRPQWAVNIIWYVYLYIIFDIVNSIHIETDHFFIIFTRAITNNLKITNGSVGAGYHGLWQRKWSPRRRKNTNSPCGACGFSKRMLPQSLLPLERKPRSNMFCMAPQYKAVSELCKNPVNYVIHIYIYNYMCIYIYTDR